MLTKINGKRNKVKRRRQRPNAMIIVENRKMRIFRYVNPKHIPSNSFEKDYKGHWMHLLGLDTGGHFWPIESLSPKEKRMPTDLFMAKNCAEEVNEVFGMSMSTSTKIGIGLLVFLCFGILIVIFLMVTAAGGG